MLRYLRTFPGSPMQLGPVWLDWYNAHQYIMVFLAVGCLFVGGFVAVSAGLRAALHRKFVAGAVIITAGVFVPTATMMTPIVGQWLESVWNWAIYYGPLTPSTGYGYGGYGYYNYAYKSAK